MNTIVNNQLLPILDLNETLTTTIENYKIMIKNNYEHDYQTLYNHISSIHKHKSIPIPQLIFTELNNNQLGNYNYVYNIIKIDLTKTKIRSKTIETIIHEYAHYLCSNYKGFLPYCRKIHHSNKWGVFYSKIYRSYLEFRKLDHLI